MPVNFCECESGPCAARRGHPVGHCHKKDLAQYDAGNLILGVRRLTLCTDCAEDFHAYIGEIREQEARRFQGAGLRDNDGRTVEEE